MIAWLKAVVIAVSAIISLGSVYVVKLKHDNPVEEISEEIIKEETGISIDLTPGSPEDAEPEVKKENKSASDGKPEADATESKK